MILFIDESHLNCVDFDIEKEKELPHVHLDYNLPMSVLKYWLWENCQIHQLVNYHTNVYNMIL